MRSRFRLEVAPLSSAAVALIGWTGVVGICWIDGSVRISCVPRLVLVSFAAVALVRWIDVVVVLQIDVVPPRSVMVESSTERM